jgi:hypothetical protein
VQRATEGNDRDDDAAAVATELACARETRNRKVPGKFLREARHRKESERQREKRNRRKRQLDG